MPGNDDSPPILIDAVADYFFDHRHVGGVDTDEGDYAEVVGVDYDCSETEDSGFAASAAASAVAVETLEAGGGGDAPASGEADDSPAAADSESLLAVASRADPYPPAAARDANANASRGGVSAPSLGPPEARAARAVGDASPYLHDMVRQGEDWAAVVSECRGRPELASYASPPPSLRTPLHEACKSGAPCPVAAALLLAAPWTAGARDGAGNAPLHLVFAGAAGGGESSPSAPPVGDVSPRVLLDVERSEVVDHLLSAYPDAVGAQNGRGATPLMMCCDDPCASPEMIQSLVLACPGAASLRDAWGRTALARYCDGGGRSLSAARLLLDAFPGAVGMTDSEGRTPLHRPAFDGNVDVVETLLLRDETIAAAMDKKGRTALHRACQGLDGRTDVDGAERRLRTVGLLLEACPGAASVPDAAEGRLPVHYACRNRRPSAGIVRYLLGADPSCAAVPDPGGYAALHSACDNDGAGGGGAGAARDGDLPDIVDLILRADPSLARRVTRKLDTPLHLAAGRSYPSVRIVRALARAYPGAVLERNDYGYTPLHCACRSYEPDAAVVAELLRAGRDADGDSGRMIGKRTNNGETALHLAAAKALVSVQVVNALLEAHSESERRAGDGSGDMTNKAGNTPLHEACFRRSSPGVVRALSRARPAWASVRNGAGYTPLHLACKSGAASASADVVLALLDAGGAESAAAADGAGHLPLHSLVACLADGASSDGGEASVRVLAEAYPAALVTATARGDTPLHLACIRNVGSEVMVTVAELTATEEGRRGSGSVRLGRRDRLPLRRNDSGSTPLDALAGHLRLTSRLMSAAADVPWDELEGVGGEVDLFDKIETLIRLVHFGTGHDRREFGWGRMLHAALWVRRRYGPGAVDEEFVRRVVGAHPRQVRERDDDDEEVGGEDEDEDEDEVKGWGGGGNYPLHIEAGVALDESVDRAMPTASGPDGGGCLLDDLVRLFPAAAAERNCAGEFPLDVMVRSRRAWGGGIRSCLVAYPPAALWQVGDELVPDVLARVGTGCDFTTLFQLVRSKPDLAKKAGY